MGNKEKILSLLLKYQKKLNRSFQNLFKSQIQKFSGINKKCATHKCYIKNFCMLSYKY